MNSSGSEGRTDWREFVSGRIPEGGLFCVKGVSSVQLASALIERNGSAETDRFRFALDPKGRIGDTDLESLLESFGEAIQEHPDYSIAPDIRDLYRFALSPTSSQGRIQFNRLDQLTRLWRELASRYPSDIFLCIELEELGSDTTRKVVKPLIKTFYGSPLDEVLEGAIQREEADSSLVFTDDKIASDYDVATETIDVTEFVRDEIKAYLNQSEVICQIQKATGGELEKLDALFDDFSSSLTQFRSQKYQSEPESQQRVLELLSLTDSIELAVLKEAYRGPTPDSWSQLLRNLEENNYIKQVFCDGELRLEVDDPALKDSIRRQIDDPKKSEYSIQLAEAEQTLHSYEPNSAFIAKHYGAAGEIKKAGEWARRAAEHTYQQREFEETRYWCNRLLEWSVARDEIAVRRRLVESCRAVGAYRQALKHSSKLLNSLDVGSHDYIELALNTGELQTESDNYEAAVELFQDLLELETLTQKQRLRVRAGIAEAYYSMGQHSSAREVAEDVVEMTSTGDLQQSDLDGAEFRSRNILGKTALLSGKLDFAEELFEGNRKKAERRNWVNQKARSELNLGLLALRRTNYESAMSRLERAMQMAEAPGVLKESYFCLNKGTIHHRRFDWMVALKAYRRAAKLGDARGRDSILQLALYNLATLFRDLGQFERGHRTIDSLYERVAGSGDSFVGTLPRTLEAGLYLDAQQYRKAINTLPCSLDEVDTGISDSISFKEEQLRGIEALVQLGEFQKARKRIDKYGHWKFDEETHPQVTALSIYGQALIDQKLGEQNTVEREQLEGAMEALDKASYYRDVLRVGLLIFERIDCENSEEASQLREDLRNRIQERAKQLPDRFVDTFLDVPLHRKILGKEKQQDSESNTSEADESSADDAQNCENWLKLRRKYREIIGEDASLYEIFETIDCVADSETPVLIQGESGTGKELIAEAVHRESQRSMGPLVKVNCGAFVDNLLKSELFGHVEGAFTGAISDKVGCFEKAEGGTILLDEIGEISEQMQISLLRILQDKTFQRVGESETREADVRVVCATNRDLERMVEAGSFRLDLYYRLKGVVLELPPLRQRRQDIPILIRHFIEKYSESERPPSVDEAVIQHLASYNWPGNIRELENFIQSLLLFTDDKPIQMEALESLEQFFENGDFTEKPLDIDFSAYPTYYDGDKDKKNLKVESKKSSNELEADSLVNEVVSTDVSLGEVKERLQQASIQQALEKTGGNISQAARLLDMNRSRLSQIVNGNEELLELKQKLVN